MVPESRRTGALCACGCLRRCLPACRYASRACMPSSERSRLSRESRVVSARLQRLRRFKQDLDRLPRRMTREDIAAVLYDVYRRGYHAGRSIGVRATSERGAA